MNYFTKITYKLWNNSRSTFILDHIVDGASDEDFQIIYLMDGNSDELEKTIEILGMSKIAKSLVLFQSQVEWPDLGDLSLCFVEFSWKLLKKRT